MADLITVQEIGVSYDEDGEKHVKGFIESSVYGSIEQCYRGLELVTGDELKDSEGNHLFHHVRDTGGQWYRLVGTVVQEYLGGTNLWCVVLEPI